MRISIRCSLAMRQGQAYNGTMNAQSHSSSITQPWVQRTHPAVLLFTAFMIGVLASALMIGTAVWFAFAVRC